MKRLLIYIIFMGGLFQSCISQPKDLEKVQFTDGYTNILKDVKRLGEQAEPATTLPLSYTFEVSGYRFGEINIPESSEEETQRNSVGVFLNNTEERFTKGIKIELQNEADLSNALLDYLLRTYGDPQILSPVPLVKADEVRTGYAAFYWDRPQAVVMVLYYEKGSISGKGYISSVLYMVDRQALINTANGNETVVDHLKRTFDEKAVD